MKKLLLLLSAFALVMGLSQCRKPNMPVLNAGETQYVVLNASWDNGGSKIEQNGTGLKWNENDKLYVNKEDGTPIGTLICKDPGNGTFEGYIMKTTGNITFTFGSKTYDETFFLNQTGALNDAVLLESGDVPYSAVGKYDISMKMPHAVLLLDLSELGTTAGTTVTIKAGGIGVASVDGVKNDEASKALYVAVPVASESSIIEYEFESNVGAARCNGWKLVENTFYTVEGGTGEAIIVKPAYRYIDLGLPSDTLWADRNVGAEYENAAGWFFSWGNITGYVWTSSKWVEASDNTKSFSGFTLGNYTGTPGKSLNEDIPVNAEYDAALLYCGGDCRIPTRIEYQELLDNADWAWDNEKKGYIISDKNNPDNKIFLYAAGNGTNDGTYGSPGIGHYWTSTYYSTNFSYDLRIASGETKLSADYERNHGFTIRAVKPATAE